MESIKFTKLENGNLKIQFLQNRHVIYRNFAGRPTQYNKNGGKRTFTIVIPDPETAQKLANDGWNVKIKPAKNNEDELFCTLEVRVRFDLSWVKPKVWQYTKKARLQVNEDNIDNFDNAEFERVDIVIRPYLVQKPSGDTVVSAQLSEMCVKIAEQELEAEWAEEEFPTDDEDDLPFN